MQESLEKAAHESGFLVSHLREALTKSTAVESVIILPLIKRANDLKNELNALLNSIEADIQADLKAQAIRGMSTK